MKQPANVFFFRSVFIVLLTSDESPQTRKNRSHSIQVEQRKKEQKKYGIHFDDDYDYLQHLRDPAEPPERHSVNVEGKEDEDEDDDDYEDEEEDEEDDQIEELDEKQDVIEESNEVFLFSYVDPKLDFDFGLQAIRRFQLPSTVFESRTTNEIGMLNLAAPDSGLFDRKTQAIFSVRATK